jgi:hypothetical protein
MNISSFNVTDVGYHYIGLRVLAATPGASRDEQTSAIARSVSRYARDKALRLMLPEPNSAYESVGEKVCQELVHFAFAEATKGRGYELTRAGTDVLALLNERKHTDLRRRMALIHLKTYDNLQAVVHTHITHKGVLSPVVEATKSIDTAYIATLLRPTFGPLAQQEAEQFLENLQERSPKKIEDALRERVLKRLIPQHSIAVPLFRAMCDRLVSLRLFNAMKVSCEEGEFNRTYSPCVEGSPTRRWHHCATTSLSTGEGYTIYLSEPDLDDGETQQSFLTAVDGAFAVLKEQAGYYDLPDVRDFVCDNLQIPEAAFDEGVLALMDKKIAPITLGLTYERISGRRKPLVRVRESTQIFNLIRRA